MVALKPSQFADSGLAPSGQIKIDWVRRNMPILNQIKARFVAEQPFAGLNVLCCLHLEAKTAYLAQILAAGGARVAVCGSNAHSTKDDVAAALATSGVRVYAHHGASDAQMHQYMNDALDIEPNIIIDDGGDIVEILHTERRELLTQIWGACEETTSGVVRAQAREQAGELAFPVVLINDARCKYLFDNYHGTGQSVWDGFMRATNLSICGRTVVVIGYGWCGKGCADRARGLGARVIVCEVDPVSAVEAHLQGFEVMPLREAVTHGDVLLTVTGGKHALDAAHFPLMKDGVVLANAGHFAREINLGALREQAVAVQELRENVQGFEMSDGRWLYLLGNGGLVNISCADGHPADIMDTSFALQALSAQYLVRQRGQSRAGTVVVPEQIDLQVASLRLSGLGVQIDTLTEQQRDYLICVPDA